MNKIRSFADIPESPIKRMVSDLLDVVDMCGIVGADTRYRELVATHKLTRGEAAALASYFQISYDARRENPLEKYIVSLDVAATGKMRQQDIRIFGERNEGIIVDATSEKEAKNIINNDLLPGQQYNPFYLKAKRVSIKKNPVPLSRAAQQKKAQLLYSDFTGHEPGEHVYIDKPVMPDVMSVIGDVDGILYTTIRDGVTEKYIHRFKKNSRPLFCVAPDGLSIHIIGGSYEFGERGIIDK